MNSLTDTFKLNNGVEIPCIGFGTWQMKDGKETVDAVTAALNAGYRHIDTAAVYDNEKGVGQAVNNGPVPRKEVFVTSKLWNTERGYDKALKAFDATMGKLGMDYLDLYLIHWPAAKGDAAEWQALNRDTWKALEKLYRDKRVRAIGISNFLKNHMEPLLASAEVVPAVNQLEFHPGYMQPEAVEYCHKHNIVVEAWSPLGSGKLLDNPVLKEIAARYEKSPAQVCLRWCLQKDTLPLPKSVTPARIEQNAAIFDFTLAPEDLHKLDNLGMMGESGLHPDKVDF